jgi:hypothetical protein
MLLKKCDACGEEIPEKSYYNITVSVNKPWLLEYHYFDLCNQCAGINKDMDTSCVSRIISKFLRKTFKERNNRG